MRLDSPLIGSGTAAKARSGLILGYKLAKRGIKILSLTVTYSS
jgi:hypothetical protein